MSDSNSPERDDGLRSLDLQLPPLPQSLPEVLKLLHEPGFVDAGGVAEIAKRDPDVSSGLLKQINSHYGLRRSIASVERAVRMMGSTSAAGTVIGLSMSRMRQGMEGPAGPSFERLMRHCEAVAVLTQLLLTRMPGEERGPRRRQGRQDGEARSDGFTEGLLHDFGKMVLIYNYPEKGAQLYDDKLFEDYLPNADDRVLEQLVFGHDHAETGAYAASKMNFPKSLVEIVRYHHDSEPPSLKGEAVRCYDAVRAANLAAKAMGPTCNGVSPTKESIEWEVCFDHPVWDRWRVEGEEGEATSVPVRENLQAKENDMVLFTDFFIDGPDYWIEANVLP